MCAKMTSILKIKPIRFDSILFYHFYQYISAHGKWSQARPLMVLLVTTLDAGPGAGYRYMLKEDSAGICLVG